jgi:hypothetical protein
MAKYLDTSQISSELMQLLKEAKERIILVTFSLKVNTQIQERLKTKSKLGTLGEITIIYGNTKLKSSELKWMEEIDDLKIFQKKNLHAKCYINEKKAIISSMNLYDYSQSTNVEMGFLIKKDEDPEAYKKMMEDIDDLRINGIRKKPFELEETVVNNIESPKFEKESKVIFREKLSYSQQVKKQLLEYFRDELSQRHKRNGKSILSDETIVEISSQNNLTLGNLKNILKSDRKVKELGDEIILITSNYLDYTVGKVLDTRYQNDDFSYDQVKLKILNSGEEKWFDTKEELPKKHQFVAVRLNSNWFNNYFILKENDKLEDVGVKSKNFNFSNSRYLTTKEISEISEFSSREINSKLVAYGLMYKKNSDWHATQRGESFGANQKEGQYGKFIIWPEEIVKELEISKVY